ncbi:hypothetical protein BH11PSE2_BH11PSE2_10600 [soil metagenome]
MKTFLIATAATMILSGAAMAQEPATPAAPAAPAAPAKPSVAVTDAELKKFAAAAAETKRIADEYQPKIAAAAADPAAKAKAEGEMSGQMQVAVTDQGFSVQRYNEIATAMQTDKDLVARLTVASAAATPGTAPASTSQ